VIIDPSTEADCDNYKSTLISLFKPLMSINNAERLSYRGVVVAIREVLSVLEAKAYFHIAKQEKTEESTAVITSFNTYILKSLNPSFLFIVRDGVMWPIRRPGILKEYSYSNYKYIALSERELMTGTDGTLRIVELGSFAYLPKPIKATKFGRLCKNWKCESEDIDNFLKENFHDKPHKSQIDIFQEKEFNFLLYKGYKFSKATPSATDIPSHRLEKTVLDH